MSEKTFFFRKDYTLKEMYDRIYAENFVNHFKRYASSFSEGANQNEINKNNCYLGLFETNNYDQSQVYSQIKPVFDQEGRKGDKLNVKLFRIPPFSDDLSQIKDRIEEIKGNNRNIKEIDSLSCGIKYDLFLTDLNFNNASLDFKFKIETSTIVHEPFPSRQTNATWIETRFYYKSGIIAVHNPDGTFSQSKDILSVIHLLFHQHSLKIEEIHFDEAQLIMIQLKLKGEVSNPKFKSDDDLRIDIYGLNEMNYQRPVVQLVQSDQSLRVYELSTIFVIEGHRFRLRLTEEGRIQVETYVIPKVLDRIIYDIEWVVISEKFYKSLEDQVLDIYKRKMRAPLRSQLQGKVKEVINDLTLLLEENKTKGMNDREKRLVSTIMLNVGHFLCDSEIDKYISEDVNEYTTEKYPNLLSYFSAYMTIFKTMNKMQSDELAAKVVKLLQHLCKVSTGDAVNLIEEYESLIKE
ncbi:hypothetical protein [Neobacillus sp. SuZ13]|uniref:hypothetical protein n=1 Tax=Neobacillus sp. SuZ13 TaxID=3047875 RepID=UPI0024C00116|nr:hypothetical protein [Neobacillus sp. SuZ13]WHY65366.1 hypothetical protein QNH17_20040 [Neobacillus sp. SuZ13]